MSDPGTHGWWLVTFSDGTRPQRITISEGEARGATAIELAKKLHSKAVKDAAPIPSPFCYQPNTCAGKMQCPRAPRCTS